MSAITPCLWFDGTAEEAARFYASLLPTPKAVTDRLSQIIALTDQAKK